MAIFAIIAQPGTNSTKLPSAVADAFGAAHYPLENGVWLVSAAGTAKDVSDRLGISPAAENGTGVVVEVASYFGRANPAIWSWIKANWEGAPVG